MTDDHVTPETRQALDLMAATLHSTPELHDDMGLRLSWLLAQIVVDVAGIPDADDRASVLTNIHDDLVRLTEHWAAEAKRALATRRTIN